LGPAALAVLLARLTGIAEEMGAALRRAAFSPNIKERADCSAALFTASGDLLVQAEHIPVHLGSMPASVAAVLGRFGTDLPPGIQYAVNDPYHGGTHLNDLTLVRPVHVDGKLIGWVANRAHHADTDGPTSVASSLLIARAKVRAEMLQKILRYDQVAWVDLPPKGPAVHFNFFQGVPDPSTKGTVPEDGPRACACVGGCVCGVRVRVLLCACVVRPHRPLATSAIAGRRGSCVLCAVGVSARIEKSTPSRS
jgi:hypothetical protein